MEQRHPLHLPLPGMAPIEMDHVHAVMVHVEACGQNFGKPHFLVRPVLHHSCPGNNVMLFIHSIIQVQVEFFLAVF